MSNSHSSSPKPVALSEVKLDKDNIRTTLQFEDNLLLAQMIGDHDRYLVQIEKELGIRLGCRGNCVVIEGDKHQVELAKTVLSYLYRHLANQSDIDSTVVHNMIGMTKSGLIDTISSTMDQRQNIQPSDENRNLSLPSIPMRRGVITPRSAGQAEYLSLLSQVEMVFGIGPAGTGKTFLAVAQAVSMLQSGQVDRIILSRPAVEAGERLGFLPGDMKDKIDPYLRPLYDALHAMLPGDQVMRRIASGEIEVAPLAFMRGRTLEHSFVILDEAQNTTSVQMKMFLTRLGPGSRMVITGDLSQIDLPPNVKSGLKDAIETLQGVHGIEIMRFTAQDVVRHPLVSRIVKAYDQRATNAKSE